MSEKLNTIRHTTPPFRYDSSLSILRDSDKNIVLSLFSQDDEMGEDIVNALNGYVEQAEQIQYLKDSVKRQATVIKGYKEKADQQAEKIKELARDYITLYEAREDDLLIPAKRSIELMKRYKLLNQKSHEKSNNRSR